MKYLCNCLSAILLLLAASPAFAEKFWFEIYALENSRPRLLAKGEKSYAPAETVITNKGFLIFTLMDKELSLGNGFAVGVTDTGERDSQGLGFWLRRQPGATDANQYEGFSWEWFDRSSGRVFRKLQGKGEIRVETQRILRSDFIRRVEFLDDTVFRMNANREGRPGDVTHYMVVKKGSILAFPYTEPIKPSK